MSPRSSHYPKYLSSLLCLALEISATSADESYATCDEDSIPSSKSASSLTPNTFHKICPPVYPTSQSLGQPICGDGTAFSFFYTSPIQRLANKEKVLIEFMGGGACWDADTCDVQSNYLTFPEMLNEFTGYSCSEAEYGMAQGGSEANLLCTSKFGSVDLTEYNTIVVPYCSQDVHIGDSYTNYEDDNDGGSGIYHHGAHNMMSVLNWVYENYPNPSHIVLTGCSAGGAVLPIAYDLINKHYNTVFSGGRTVNINVISDSPVYLTPEYFLYFGFGNWNPWTILSEVRFHYDEWRYNVQYSTKLWEHVLKRGSARDQWGFVSHTYDSIAIAYWQAMGGNYDADDDAADSTWYSDIMDSLDSVTADNTNVDTFFIDGNGHCTFGFYYALEEDGFEEWAEGILQEQDLLLRTASSFPLFLFSVLVGFALTYAAYAAGKRSSDAKSDSLLQQKVTTKQKVASSLAPIISAAERFKSCPITTGYFVATTLYLFCMIFSDGFEHPLNNPSLGPSASTLSSFGINNPTLIVDDKQVYRLVTSAFLCSGVLTYFMILHSILRCVRHLERILDNTKVFASACVCITLGSNVIYALLSEGASCSSVAFVLGLNCFSIGLRKNYQDIDLPSPWLLTILQTLLACILFPFNNYIMILAAIVIGSLILPLAVKIENSSNNSGRPVLTFNNAALLGIVGVLAIAFILLLAGVPEPNEMYRYPYTTGCEMKYSLDINDIADQLDGGGRRRLKDDNNDNNDNNNNKNNKNNNDNNDKNNNKDNKDNKDDNYDGFCAQFCVPHLIELPFSWSIAKFTGYSLVDGICSNIGYDTHVADKTYTYWEYSLDVELYY